MQTSGPGRKLSDELVAFVHGGVAVSVATRDGDLTPAFTRGVGAAAVR